MKLGKTFILSCLIISLISLSVSKLNEANKKSGATKTSTNSKGRDILGASSNLTKENVSAITYGLADIEEYDVPKNELLNLKSVVTLPKLPEKFDLPRPGPLENPEEVASASDYYDGSLNLNKKKISCKIHGNAAECLKNSSCGWCGSKKSCILGNNLGPLQSCLRSTFLYSSPLPNWNPRARVENKGGDGLAFTLSNQ